MTRNSGLAVWRQNDGPVEHVIRVPTWAVKWNKMEATPSECPMAVACWVYICLLAPIFHDTRNWLYVGSATRREGLRTRRHDRDDKERLKKQTQ